DRARREIFLCEARRESGFGRPLYAARGEGWGRSAGGSGEIECGSQHQREFRRRFRRREIDGIWSAQGRRAYFHAMGTDAAQDTKVFGDGYTPDKILAVDLSEDQRYLLFTVFYGSACDRSGVYFQDLKIAGPIVPVVNTLDGCFQGAIANDTLYLQTNWKAPKWRLVAVPLRTPSQEHWKEIVPEGESRMEDFRPVGGKIVAQYSHNAASELKIFQSDGNAAGGIALPQLGTVAGVTGR